MVIFKRIQTLNYLLSACACLLQCESDYVLVRPCEGDLGRQPYAKRECALLYSDVFAPCHNVVSLITVTHVLTHMHNTHRPLQPVTWLQLRVFRRGDDLLQFKVGFRTAEYLSKGRSRFSRQRSEGNRLLQA